MQAQFNQAISLHKAGQLQQAEAIYRQLLQQEESHPVINARLAILLHQTQRSPEAMTRIKLAIEALPDDCDLLIQGITIATELSETRLAEKWIRAAIKFRPSDIALQEQLAGVLIGNHKEKEALEVAKNVIKLDPKSAGAYNLKGLALSRLGETEKGYKAFQKSVKLNPGHMGVIRNLIIYGKNKKEPILDAVIPQLEQRVNQGNQPDIVQMNMAYIVSMYYEQQGNAKHYSPQKAFHYLKLGNDINRGNYSYQHKQTQHQFAELVSLFNEKLKAVFEGQGLEDASPIFILGMPRSGTTLIEQILSSHSLVEAEGEIDDLNLSINSSQLMGKIHNETEMVQVCQDTVKDYLRRVRMRQSAPLFTDKMPYNFMFVGLIAMALPKAKIIHCTRDPLETCFSIYKQNFSGSHAYTNDLQELGQYYNLYQSLMDHWQGMFGDQIYEANYEKLVENSEQQIKELLEFCGLEAEAKCFEFHKNKRAVRTASVAQVRQPIYKDAMKASAPYLDELRPLIDTLKSGVGKELLV